MYYKTLVKINILDYNINSDTQIRTEGRAITWRTAMPMAWSAADLVPEIQPPIPSKKQSTPLAPEGKFQKISKNIQRIMTEFNYLLQSL